VGFPVVSRKYFKLGVSVSSRDSVGVFDGDIRVEGKLGVGVSDAE
jgi:hypothetical protein